MSLDALNFVDYLVLVVLVISGVLATLRGLTRELMGLAGWLVAIIAARLFKPVTISFLEDYIKEDSIVETLGWFLPFMVVLLAWFVFSNIASPSLKKMALGNMDRILGFIFGVFRGIVVVAIIYVAVLAITKSEDPFPESVLNSLSIAPVRIVATIITGIAPDDFREEIQDAIPKQDLDDIRDGISDQFDDGLDKTQGKTEDIIEDSEDGDLQLDEQIIRLPENN
jgi:membrane protein required for colicin V production